MADTIFAKIIAGQIPCHRIFEDDHVLAFLDINPLAEGHTLVVPKFAAARLADLPADSAAALGRCLPAVVRRITAATVAPACNVLLNDGQAAGQEVPHVHYHVIPRAPGDGLGYRWHPQQRTPEALAALAERIRQTR